MQIRRVFHNEEELIQHLGEPFLRKWKRLLSEYAKRSKSVGSCCLKAASVAFVLYNSVKEGDRELLTRFEEMTRDYSQEVLVMDNVPLRLDEGNADSLVWDTMVLMMDEDDGLCQRAQWAYDMAEMHVWMAYSCGNPVEHVFPSRLNAQIDACGVCQCDEVGKPAVSTISQVCNKANDNVLGMLVGEALKMGDKTFCEKLELALRHVEEDNGICLKDEIRTLRSFNERRYVNNYFGPGSQNQVFNGDINNCEIYGRQGDS